MNVQYPKRKVVYLAIILVIISICAIIFNNQFNHETNQPSSIQLLFLGDFMIGDSYNGPVNYPFQSIKSLFEQKNDIIINLETAITNRTTTENSGKSYLYKIDGTVLNEMCNRNITIVNLANNHALDYGKKGFNDTIHSLETNNISFFGAGENESNSRMGMIKEYPDLTTVGYLGYFEYRSLYDYTYHFYATHESSGVAILNQTNLQRDIKRMKNDSDIVIVSFHIGANYNPKITSIHKDYAHLAIDNGADVVICHSAHIILPMEWYNEHPIFYSLGNSIFTTPGRFRDVDEVYHHGLGIILTMKEKQITSIELIPFKTDNRETGYQPQFISGNELENVLNLIIPSDINYQILDSSARIDY